MALLIYSNKKILRLIKRTCLPWHLHPTSRRRRRRQEGHRPQCSCVPMDSWTGIALNAAVQENANTIISAAMCVAGHGADANTNVRVPGAKIARPMACMSAEFAIITCRSSIVGNALVEASASTTRDERSAILAEAHHCLQWKRT